MWKESPQLKQNQSHIVTLTVAVCNKSGLSSSALDKERSRSANLTRTSQHCGMNNPAIQTDMNPCTTPTSHTANHNYPTQNSNNNTCPNTQFQKPALAAALGKKKNKTGLTEITHHINRIRHCLDIK
ncbi:hypothetical protein ACLB2K_070620 [Fragaria x ananassa]